VWDTWRPPSPEGAPTEAERPERIESCAVLTTRSGGVVREIHDRMPLILGPDEWDAWLGGGIEDARRVLEQSQDAVERRASNLVATPVSTWVNDVRHDDPTCIEPLALEPGVATAEGAQGAFQFAASPAAPRTRSRRRRA
jgi:putative SOS response-associated peptidase YedK